MHERGGHRAEVVDSDLGIAAEVRREAPQRAWNAHGERDGPARRQLAHGGERCGPARGRLAAAVTAQPDLDLPGLGVPAEPPDLVDDEQGAICGFARSAREEIAAPSL